MKSQLFEALTNLAKANGMIFRIYRNQAILQFAGEVSAEVTFPVSGKGLSDYKWRSREVAWAAEKLTEAAK